MVAWVTCALWDTSKLPLVLRWVVKRRLWNDAHVVSGASHFQTCSQSPYGVMGLTYHLLGLYSDRSCTAWRWILSQWDSWVMVTGLQCFINRDSCVIHLLGLLAGSHVMTADQCSCILDCDSHSGKVCCSLFLRCPTVRHNVAVKTIWIT